MALSHDERTKKFNLARKHAELIEERKRALKSKLGNEKSDFLEQDGDDNSVYLSLLKAMRDPETLPSEYVDKQLGWLFGTAIPHSQRDLVLYFADRLCDYPYSDSYARRSFRSVGNGAYAHKLTYIIRSLYGKHMQVGDVALVELLNGSVSEELGAYLDAYSWQGCAYTGWQIAYALDKKDPEVEEAVRRILTEENGSGNMTVELIRGVLFSHRTDLYELIGQLLLAARLQEGLRQAICENADYGTKEAFLYLLKVIRDNDLIRYSSVKRAVGTWLGIMSEDSRALERVSAKSVSLIIDCLEDEMVRSECLESEDAMKIHIALWSYGIDDINESIRKIIDIAGTGTVHQLLVAGYFTANLDLDYLANKIAKSVLALHADKDNVLAVWLPSFLPGRVSTLWNAVRYGKRIESERWFDSTSEIRECYLLIKRLYTEFDGKSKVFSPCVFPWHEARIARSDLAELICTLAAMSNDRTLLDEACPLIKECNSDQRQFYFSAILRDPATVLMRRTVIEGLADRETYTRRAAYDIVKELKLTKDEYRTVEEYLRFKSADIRKNVIDLIMKQSDGDLTESISRLLSSTKEDIRYGGLDILTELNKDDKRRKIISSFLPTLEKQVVTADLSAKEKILIDALLPAQKEEHNEPPELYSPSDKYLPTEIDPEYTELCLATFLEYFPESKLPDLIRGKKSGFDLLGKLKTAFTGGGVCDSCATAREDIASLSRFIEEHRTDSHTNRFGVNILLGNLEYAHLLYDEQGNLLFRDRWDEWINKNGITNKRLINMLVLFYAYSEKNALSEAGKDYVKDIFGAGFESAEKPLYHTVIGPVLTSLARSVPSEARTRIASALTIWFIKCVENDKVMIYAPSDGRFSTGLDMAHLLAHNQLRLVYEWLRCENDPSIKQVFPLAVMSAKRCIRAFKNAPKKSQQSGYMVIGGDRLSPNYLYSVGGYSTSAPLVGIREYLLAAYHGVISEAALCEFIFDADNISSSISAISTLTAYYKERGRQVALHDTHKAMRATNQLRELLGKRGEPDEKDLKFIEFAAKIYDKVIPVVISSELKRGDSPAEYTSAVSNITRIFGADNLARILNALGKDTLDRTAYYGWGVGKDRKSSLSYLLSVSVPEALDTVEDLKRALDGKQISKKRLIEAALFSPEWIPLVGEYLGIESFEAVCYYFMAHMNERFDDKRKAIIARFTPLSDEELNLGAFDVNWFKSAYETIGKDEFDLVYDAAKYISDGAKHSRARKYADATLGKLDVEETERTISDKRNKDLLMAYALIPLKDDDDLCRRYLYVQRFKKESRQFGAQRIASEAKAVDMALTNLAINAGYSDTMRLTLRMETKVIDDSRALLDTHLIDGVSLRIELDENGKAGLVCKKDGKELKSVPAKLKKDERVLALTALVKTLTEQYRRTRLMLERAMEDATQFTFSELSALSAHPVVYPMIKNLVLLSDTGIGFLSEGGLLSNSGTLTSLAPEAKIKIAHPYDLYTKGVWRDYQKHLYENRITQPYRQVFRELYIKTDEEMDMLHSLRYAGNQIQPAKTAAALKSRRWVADIENGLQKVYYKENIIAELYALADWFSPADIEAPTLEWVCFTNRRTGEEMKIADVPEIVFSEVMRDVDLAVSVAHAGGVDPETSHSTMEMRSAILSFILPMFRITNVTLEGNHAIIRGKLAEYSVHLGSGVVHQIGGAMIPVLPVHSQHRGKIFLPFIDDDPKTAEIISKVLLFAEDGKIKDPMILSALSLTDNTQ